MEALSKCLIGDQAFIPVSRASVSSLIGYCMRINIPLSPNFSVGVRLHGNLILRSAIVQKFDFLAKIRSTKFSLFGVFFLSLFCGEIRGTFLLLFFLWNLSGAQSRDSVANERKINGYLPLSALSWNGIVTRMTVHRNNAALWWRVGIMKLEHICGSRQRIPREAFRPLAISPL